MEEIREEEHIAVNMNEVKYITPDKDLLKPKTFVLDKFISRRGKSTSFSTLARLLHNPQTLHLTELVSSL